MRGGGHRHKRRPDGSGWNIYKTAAGQDMGIDAPGWRPEPWNEWLGAERSLLTSMDCDGTKAGWQATTTAAVADARPAVMIASGVGQDKISVSLRCPDSAEGQADARPWRPPLNPLLQRSWKCTEDLNRLVPGGPGNQPCPASPTIQRQRDKTIWRQSITLDDWLNR